VCFAWDSIGNSNPRANMQSVLHSNSYVYP
jgi:hypothetical protein